MLKCAVGQAEGLDGRLVVELVLEQCASQLDGLVPQAGILFGSGRYDYAEVLSAIAARYPNLSLVGCSSGGDVTSALGFCEDSLALLLLHSDDLVFSTGVIDPQREDPAQTIARALATDPRQPSLCLIFPSWVRLDGDALIELLQPILPSSCAVFGGRAAVATGARYDALLQFCGTTVFRDATPFLFIHDGGRLRYSFTISNAWTPVGSKQRVTQSEGQRVLRIGEGSALDYYRHYLGPHSRPATEFPLAVFEDDETHYFLRVAQAFEPATGAVIHAGSVKEGALVQLTEAVRDKMLQDIATSAASSLTQLEQTPELVLMISCAARKSILGSRIVEEIRLVESLLPSDVPIFGLYAWGEIAPCAPGWPSRTHNATLVTLMLSSEAPGSHAVRLREPPPLPPLLSAQVDVVSYAADIVEGLYQGASITDRGLVNTRLRRSEYYRLLLEDTRELHSAMLRTINAEIEAVRRKIEEQNQTLQRLYGELGAEKKKSDDLLLSILPRDIAEELKRTSRVEPIYYPMASVLFTDFVGFTRIASSMSPAELLAELDHFFSAFDRIVEAHGLEKLKTIGDAYMCAGGVPTPKATHAEDTVAAAWEMKCFMDEAIADRKRRGLPYWELRVGVHCGPLMAGVIGRRKFAYDVWGNTVNLASRLESTSEPGCINISRDVYEKVRTLWECEPRGKVLAKNAGEIDMYFVRGRVSPNQAK